MQVPGSFAGWFAFGFGHAMDDAEVYLAYQKEDGSIQLDRRKSTGFTEPAVTATDFQLNGNKSGLDNGVLAAVFTRAITSNQVDGTNINMASQNLIWALNNQGPAANPLRFHSQKGHLFSANLQDPTAAYTSQRDQNTKTQNSTQITSSDDTSVTSIQIHGWLMVFAWFFFTPTSIAVASYFKRAIGPSWFKFHVASNAFVLLLSAVGLVFAWKAVGKDHLDFMKPEYRGNVGGIHVFIGTIVLFGLVLQTFSGIVSDRMYDPLRKTVPFRDKFHWIGGRSLLFLSWICVPLGITLYGQVATSDLVYVFLGILFIWSILLVLIGAYFEQQYGQQHEFVQITEEIEEI